MSDLVAAKAAWRARLRVRLAAMTPEERAAQSEAICNRVRRMDAWQAAAVLLLYRPMATEVDVTALWQDGDARQCRIYFPRVEAREQPLRFVRVGRDTEWDKYLGCLLQPRAGERLTAAEAAQAMIVVPGLGFSSGGGRLGRGGGYYDRTLATPPISRHGCRIGLAFQTQVVEGLPVGPSDVLMDAVVAPKNTFVAGLPLPSAT